MVAAIETQPHSRIADVLAAEPTTGFAAGKDDQSENDTDGILHIRPTNLLPNGELNLSKGKYVPPPLNAAEYLQRGEVLFNNTNSEAWVGKACLFDTEGKYVCSNHITRLTVDTTKISAEFLVATLNMLQAKGYFGVLSTNFNNQAGINTNTLKNAIIPVPSLAVQQELVAKIDAARARRAELLRQADEELANIDVYVSEIIGIE